MRGTLRGIHFQTEPGQAKLVRRPCGKIFDVAVDLRRGSPAYGHGFAVLSDVADVAYLLSSVYDPATESGIAWDDPEIGVEWPLADPLLSERDKAAPRLADVAETLPS